MDDTWESRRQSAPLRRREASVPADRAEAFRARPVGLEVCHFVSCQRSLCSQTWRLARSKKMLDGAPGKSPVAWLGFSVCDPGPTVPPFYVDDDWASDKVSRRSTSGGVLLSSWASKLLSAITESTRSLGIRNELKVFAPVVL